MILKIAIIINPTKLITYIEKKVSNTEKKCWFYVKHKKNSYVVQVNLNISLIIYLIITIFYNYIVVIMIKHVKPVLFAWSKF